MSLRPRIRSRSLRGPSFTRTGARTWAALFLPLFVVATTAQASPHQLYRTISTTSPRPMAMGGAFISVRDDLAALNWNPASFSLFDKEVTHQLTIYFNPIVTSTLLYEDHRDIGDVIAGLGTIVKAVTYSHHWAELGLLLWEEPFHDTKMPSDGRLFRADRILEHNSHSLGARIRLAPSVSLGAAGNLYQIQDDKGHSSLAGGVNYGVLLKPTRGLEIGLAYFDYPSFITELRQDMEGLQDESVNGGISFHPDESTIMALDLRNTTEGDKIGWDKFRFGLEHTFLHRLALRLGYFQSHQGQNDVYSFGMGWRQKKQAGESLLLAWFKGCSANYALLVEEGKQSHYHWHLFSLLLAI
jgi:hypothetical protein